GLAPARENVDRHAGGACRDVQRPAKMLSRMAQTDSNAIVFQYALVEGQQHVQLGLQRWRGFNGAMRETTADLSGQPWLPLRAAADHGGIGAGLVQRLARIFEGQDVTVDDERNRDGIPDRANGVPVRLPLVELTACATVNGDELNTCSFSS